MTNPASNRRRPSPIGPIVVALGLLAAWELVLVAADIPRFILPRPTEVMRAVAQGINSGVLGRHFGVTATETVLGFAIGSLAAIVLGIPIAMSGTVERYLYPYILALQTTPKIALAPILIIWVGIGISSKVIIAAIIVLFPVMINLVAGARAAEPAQLELLAVYEGDLLDEIRYVRLPTALPYLFAGLKTASVLGLLGAVTGEFVGSTAGLGYLLTQDMNRLDTPAVFAVLVVLMLFGLALYLLMERAERICIYWRVNRPETAGRLNALARV